MRTTILGFLISCFLGVSLGAAQDGTKTRSITSDDFASQRPATAKVPGRKYPRAKRYQYKFVRSEKNPVKAKPAQPKPTASNAAKVTDVGVTMWRMRPPKSNEAGQLLPVIDAQKTRQMWFAERVSIDTKFAAGDKIRFAIESSEIGYLYIFDRETYSDGSLGAPYLIFPESPLDDNSVGPGSIVDIPDQRDDVPYFNISPKNANYAGEMMTVIISPTPITDFRTDGDGKLINIEPLSVMEFGTEVELFSRADNADKLFSKTEASATCGSKSRVKSDASPGKPCGIKTRQLTRDEPFPQSIFRVKTTAGEPAVAFVRLTVQP